MVKVKIWGFILIITLVLYIFARNAVLKKRYVNALSDISLYKLRETNYHKTILQQANKIIGNEIDIAKISVTDSVGKEFSLFDLLDSMPTLIYRFKESSCDACYSDQIDRLKTFKQEAKDIPIILLVTFTSPNDIKIISRVYHSNFPIYSINPEQLAKSPFENYNEPYHFLINKDLKTTSLFFIPNKALPELTDQYLHLVESIF